LSFHWVVVLASSTACVEHCLGELVSHHSVTL
jgi:hypothetical protein